MQFSDWQVIGRGVYEGTPQLSLKWTGSTNILTCTVLGKDGNLYEVEERAPGQWGNPLRNENLITCRISHNYYLNYGVIQL